MITLPPTIRRQIQAAGIFPAPVLDPGNLDHPRGLDGRNKNYKLYVYNIKLNIGL